MTSFTEELHDKLLPFRARIRRLLIERYLCLGAAVAAGVAMLLIVIDELLPSWYVEELGLLSLFLLGAVAGAVYGATRPLTDFAVARTIERRRNLKERASTAVAMAANPDSNAELRGLVTADALAHLTEVTPPELFPHRFTNRHKLPLIMWVVAVLLFLLPSIPWLQSPQTRQERATLRQSGKELSAYAKEMLKQPDIQHSKTAKDLTKRMLKLGQEMEKLRIPKKEAMIRLNKLQEQMKKSEAQIAKELAEHEREMMRKAAEALRAGMAKRSDAEKNAAEQARQKLANGIPREKLTQTEREALAREEAMNKLANSLENGDASAANQQMQQMGQQLQQNTGMSQQDRQQMGQSLQQAAQQMQQSGNTQQMGQSMQQAGQQMQTGTQQGQQQAAQTLQNTVPLPPGMMPGQTTMGRMQQGLGQSRQGVGANKPAQLGAMPGQGQGQGMGMGQGQGQSQGQGQGSMAGQGSGGAGGHGHGGGALNNQHNPGDPEDHHGEGLNPSHGNANDPKAASYSVDIKGAPGQADRSNVPYTEVLPSYQQSAESAINNDQVPASERQRVRDYFNKLNPGN